MATELIEQYRNRARTSGEDLAGFYTNQKRGFMAGDPNSLDPDKNFSFQHAKKMQEGYASAADAKTLSNLMSARDGQEMDTDQIRQALKRVKVQRAFMEGAEKLEQKRATTWQGESAAMNQLTATETQWWTTDEQQKRAQESHASSMASAAAARRASAARAAASRASARASKAQEDAALRYEYGKTASDSEVLSELGRLESKRTGENTEENIKEGLTMIEQVRQLKVDEANNKDTASTLLEYIGEGVNGSVAKAYVPPNPIYSLCKRTSFGFPAYYTVDSG